MNRFAFSWLLALSIVAAACSSGDESSATTTSTTIAPANATTTTSPESLAFVEQGPLTLRVSVPSLDFVAPYEVDETDAVEVFVTDLLTDGLTIVDLETGIAEPGVASSWSKSADGLVWTFKLGQTTFGNGTTISSKDVVASLNAVANKGVRSISGAHMWPIEGWEAAAIIDAAESSGDDADAGEPEATPTVSGIVAVDPTTVTITLTEQFEPLPQLLAGVAFGIWPETVDESSDVPVGSAVDFIPAALWADGLRLQLAQPIDGEVSTIELFVDTENTMVAVGETDMAIGVDPIEPLGELRGVTVQRSADAFFAMNSTIAPFDDPMIRQAIVLATNREAIRAEYFPTSGLMQSFVPQLVLGGVADACGESCDYNVEHATTLVNASPSRDVAITVDYFTSETAGTAVDGKAADAAGIEQRLAESIASDLRAVGLIATARAHSPAEFGRLAANDELGLFRFGSVSTAPTAEADIGAMFHTSGRDNLTGTSIDRFDALIFEARRESDPAARAAFYESAERVLFDEAVVLPLVEFRHHLVHGARLAAAGLEPDGSLNLSQVEFAADQ